MLKSFIGGASRLIVLWTPLCLAALAPAASDPASRFPVIPSAIASQTYDSAAFSAPSDPALLDPCQLSGESIPIAIHQIGRAFCRVQTSEAVQEGFRHRGDI